MPYVHTAKTNVFYTEKVGPDDGPVLVLIHGAGGSRLHWPPQLRRMPGATVYSLDLPGHGRSHGEGCRTIEAYGAAVLAFLDGVGVECAVLVGHSMGGAISLQVAVSEAARVAAAILEGAESDFLQVVDVVTEYAWSGPADQSLKEIGRRALRETGPDVVLGDFTACDRFDVMDRVSEIETPTLVVVGSDDRLTPVKYSRFLGEHLASASLVIMQEAGHMVMLERPDEVGEAIRRFVMTNG
jgi:pimeloyl-ACP methyl ester carboxylesterase